MEKKPVTETTITEMMNFLKQYDAETVDKLVKLLGTGGISPARWESQNERENQKETKTESKNEKGAQAFAGFMIKGL